MEVCPVTIQTSAPHVDAEHDLIGADAHHFVADHGLVGGDGALVRADSRREATHVAIKRVWEVFHARGIAIDLSLERIEVFIIIASFGFNAVKLSFYNSNFLLCGHDSVLKRNDLIPVFGADFSSVDHFGFVVAKPVLRSINSSLSNAKACQENFILL